MLFSYALARRLAPGKASGISAVDRFTADHKLIQLTPAALRSVARASHFLGMPRLLRLIESQLSQVLEESSANTITVCVAHATQSTNCNGDFH